MIFLVLDDNEDDVFAVRRCLKRAFGSKSVVRKANEAKEALEVVETGQLDCLLVDMHLRHSHGLDFLKALAEGRAHLPVATVVLTGSGSEQTAVAALKLGAHDYLRKDELTIERLRECVDYATDRYRAQREWREQREYLYGEVQRLNRNAGVTMQLVAGASHELRTPLTAIVGIVETLERFQGQELAIDRRDEFTRALRACCDSLLLTVDDIIDLARAEGGRLDLNPVVFSLKEELEEALEPLRILAEAKKLQLDLELSPEVEGVYYGDARRLRQVFYNLLGNALKFTERGRVQLVALPGEKENLRFEVRDTGTGIPASDQVRIFDPYVRAATGTPGSGLGLTVCQTLLNCLRAGPLGLESQPGEGSVFHFEITLERRVQDELGSPNRPGTTGASYRLLVAEDNAMVARILASQLRELGHQVTVVENGEEALGELKSNLYDAVLMDCQMPRMDGYEATRRLRQELGLSLPVIALTAEALTKERDRGLDAGMTDFLVKPVPLSRLQSVLVSYLEKPAVE